MTNKVINALMDEYLTDPIVHAHLDTFRYQKVSEQEMFIQLVKDLTVAKNYYLNRYNELLANGIPPVIIKDSNELRKVLG